MYGIEDPHFDGNRQQQLIKDLIKHIENKKSEDFSLAISNYNQITPFSKSDTSLLVRIKEMYVPEEATQFVQNEQEIDFTGANEEQTHQAAQDNEVDFT